MRYCHCVAVDTTRVGRLGTAAARVRRRACRASRSRIRCGVGAETVEDAVRDARVLAGKAEQDVLGLDLLAAERARFAERQLEHLLATRRERDLAAGRLVGVALADDARHVCPNGVEADAEVGEDVDGGRVLAAQQAEQQVLGADPVVSERACLVGGERRRSGGRLR